MLSTNVFRYVVIPLLLIECVHAELTAAVGIELGTLRDMLRCTVLDTTSHQLFHDSVVVGFPQW